MTHTCHAPGCATPTPPRLLFCPTCWALVTEVHKAAVWSAYKPIAGAGGRTTVTPAYLAAVADAKADVLDKSGGDGSGYRGMAERHRARVTA